MQASVRVAEARSRSVVDWKVLTGNPGLRLAAGFLAVAGILAAVWSQMAPSRLYDFDSANFALALHAFNPGVHLPQPPGYPLYVGLTRLANWFADDAVTAFLTAGIIAAAVAIVMLGLLASAMFGRVAGWCAALLLMTNPILWQAGMVDQVRVFLAVISTAVALALWPLWADPSRTRRFVWACLLLGLLAGFRPETLVSVTPLLLLAGFRARLAFRYWLRGAAAMILGAAPWLIVLVTATGGIRDFIDVMQRYTRDQAGNTSIVLGAHTAGVMKMFDGALWWLSLGVFAWIPALLLLTILAVAGRSKTAGGPSSAPQWTFLLAWFLTQFLFAIAIHIAAAGHALSFIPAACLVGGWAVSRLAPICHGRLAIACLLVALALNVRFFVRPYSEHTAEASYRTIHYVSRMIDSTLGQIDALTTNSKTVLIDHHGWVTWRILEVYYPSVPILHLPDPGARATEPPWLILNQRLAKTYNPQQDIELPSCGTLLWIVADPPERQALMGLAGAEDAGHFVLTPASPGMNVQIGRYRLKSSNKSCPN